MASALTTSVPRRKPLFTRAEKAILVKDDFELDHGISLEPCHGHTPGHVVINVKSNDRLGVFIGDIIHHPIQIMFPDLSSFADHDMDAARVSRRALIEKHAGTGTLILPQHFASPTCGAIRLSFRLHRRKLIQRTHIPLNQHPRFRSLFVSGAEISASGH